jgi:succinyl-diaminopimelate desuccinylase
MKQRICSVIAGYRDEIADFTAALVSIPTENPPGRAYEECARAIASKLRQLDLPVEMREISPKGTVAGDSPGYCVTSHYGREAHTLYFHGHYDVVPAQDPAQFAAQRRGRNLHGRGTSDMKGGLAAMIYAIKALQDLDVCLHGRVALVIVPDEETSGPRGTRALAAAGELGHHGIGMLTPEPTGGVIWNANRGAISLRVTMRGKAAHVGLECRGVNAFERMLQVTDALRELKKTVAKRKTAFHITPDEARQSILMLGGCCESGENFNLVPAECSITVDRRINPEEDFEIEKRALFEIFERCRRDGIDLDVELLQEGHAAGVGVENATTRALAQSVEEIIGKAALFEMCPGLLEIRYYAALGIPAFAYGPGLLSVSHGPEEFIPLDNIESCAAVYALTALRMLGSEESHKEDS